MNIGGGEAADQMVRMMLTGTEVTVRLGASAMKNLLAITLALAKRHKTLSGKVNMGKMLRETRDIRLFPMSLEQYRAFKQKAVKQKILFSVIRDSDGRGKVVDVAMPVTELERANFIFERIRYLPQDRQGPSAKEHSPVRDSQTREGRTPKKESRSEFDLAGISGSSSISKSETSTETTHERPSVLKQLKGYREQLDRQHKAAPAKNRQKTPPKQR